MENKQQCKKPEYLRARFKNSDNRNLPKPTIGDYMQAGFISPIEYKPPSIPDTINNPAHYTQGREIEPLNVIEDWKLDFYLGNALKYIARAGRKENEIEDLKKAVFYLNRKIDNLEKVKKSK